MKKILVVVALATVAAGIKADFWSDLGKGDFSGAYNDVVQSPEVQSVVTEVTKVIPAPVQTQIQEAVDKYGPAVATEVKKAVDQGQQLLAKVVPAEQQKQILDQSARVLNQAAEVAKVQLQNNPALVKQAQQLLASHQKQLDLMKKHALEIANKNPQAKNALNQYMNNVQMRANNIQQADQIRAEMLKKMKMTPFGRQIK